MIRQLWLLVNLVLVAHTANAINEEYGYRELSQPDGSTFTVRVYRDEFGLFMATTAGYVVQNPTDEAYYYARYDAEGRAAPTAMKVGGDHSVTDLARLTEANSVALSEMARRFREGTEGSSGQGAARSVRSPSTSPNSPMPPNLPDSLIVILVEFSDVKRQNPIDWPMPSLNNGIDDRIKSDYSEYTVAEFEDMLFGASYDTTSPDGDTVYGSMRKYWEDMSNGTYTLKGRVANDVRDGIPVWITLGQTKAYYSIGEEGDKGNLYIRPNRFKKAVFDSARAQQGIDTSREEDRKICIIYAGSMYSVGPDTIEVSSELESSSKRRPSSGLKPRASGGVYIMSERYFANDVKPTPRDSETNNAKFSHIGVHCHEFGHILGAADQYDEPRNYNWWGLMAAGGNAAIAERGDSPTPMSPQLRAGLGWIAPTSVSSLMVGETFTHTSNMDDVYKIGSSEDFFLIENRQTRDGWNRASPYASGLLIWHIKDLPGIRDRIDLIEADNKNTTGTYDGDPFPGSGNVRSLTDFTTPSSRQFTRSADSLRINSNVLVTNISDSTTYMTADLSPYWWGTLDSTTTWSGVADGDTVKVGADVTISSGDTLTISPGTLVRFTANSDDLGGLPFTDKCVIKVNGTLVAEGTAADSITFESDAISPAAGDWGGIAFSDSSVDASCKVTHAVIKHATYGIYSSLAMPAELNDNTISECVFGIMGLNMTDPTIQNNTLDNNLLKGLYLANVSGAGEGIKNNMMTNNGTGLYLSSSTVHIHDSIINNNTNGAHISSHTTSTLNSCTFNSNDGDGGWGIYAFLSDPVLKNCRIANNDTYGLRMYGRADPVMDDSFNPNDFSSNGTYELYLQNNCQPRLDHSILHLNDIVPSDSGYAVYIDSLSSFNKLKVRRNWWGSETPSPSLFSPADSIDYAHPSSRQNVTGAPKVATDGVALQLQQAKALERTGHLMEAAEQYRSIVTGQPDHPLARHALGRLYSTWRNSGRDMAAMAAYCGQIEQSATSENMRREARDWRLRSWLDAGRITEALQGYRAIAAATPDSPEGVMARINIADTYHHYLGDLQAAKSAYQAIATDFPGRAENELAHMALTDIQGWGVSITTELPDTSSAAHPSESLMEDGSTGVAFETRPNPANPSTTFRFSLPRAMQVELRIYNVMGQKVRTLVPLGLWPVGEHNVAWDGRNSQGHTVGSGIYVANLRAGEQLKKRKLMILK